MTLPTMSQLSNQPITPKLGAFFAYDSQLPLPEEKGNRVVKCLYQKITSGDKKGTKKAENAYTRIPTEHLTEEVIVERVSEISPYILGWLQGMENETIKKYHSDGGTQVFIAGLTFDNLIERLEESEAGSRLNKEKIVAWYNEHLLDNLTTLFAEKMGLTEQSGEAELLKLELVLNAYRDKFSTLAGGKAFIKEADCQAMIAVITGAGAESTVIGSRFISRLTKMNAVKEDLLMSL
jgi:hypothetical protein